MLGLMVGQCSKNVRLTYLLQLFTQIVDVRPDFLQALDDLGSLF